MVFDFVNLNQSKWKSPFLSRKLVFKRPFILEWISVLTSVCQWRPGVAPFVRPNRRAWVLISACSRARREYMHPDREPNISRPGLPNSVNNHVIVVFLNFSDVANPHQSVRFSRSAARLSLVYPAPRARLNLTPNLLSPTKHLNTWSDWVRVCWPARTSYGTFFHMASNEIARGAVLVIWSKALWSCKCMKNGSRLVPYGHVRFLPRSFYYRVKH